MVTITEIVDFLKTDKALWLAGGNAGEHLIEGPATLSEASMNHVSFCGHTAIDTVKALASAKPGLLLLDENIKFDEKLIREKGVIAVIISENARLDFIRVLSKFFVYKPIAGVHKTAVVEESSCIAKSAFVGPLCSIGENVRVGENTVIHSGVHIYSNVEIGANVVIHSGAVIGADGFGYERDPQGGLIKFPHLGKVIIGDNVEIGANACIDRGTLGATIIGNGAKIDNLVHIAHNTRIGDDAAVIAHSMIGGGTAIGNRSWIAPSACLRDRIEIGKDVTVGMGSCVTKNIPDGTVVYGNPARESVEQKILAEFQRSIIGRKKSKMHRE